MSIDNFIKSLKNFDPNTFFSSVVSSIVALGSQGVISILFAGIAIVSQLITIFNAIKKTKYERLTAELDLELKREDLKRKRIETSKLEAPKCEHNQDTN